MVDEAPQEPGIEILLAHVAGQRPECFASEAGQRRVPQHQDGDEDRRRHGPACGQRHPCGARRGLRPFALSLERGPEQQRQQQDRVKLDQRARREQRRDQPWSVRDRGERRAHDRRQDQAVEMGAAPHLDEHERIPGVDDDPGGRQAEPVHEQDHETESRQLCERHADLHRAHTVRGERVDGAEEGLSSGRIDRAPRRVVEAGINLVVAETADLGRHRRVGVGAQPRTRHPRVPDVAIGVGRERGQRRQEREPRHQGDAEHEPQRRPWRTAGALDRPGSPDVTGERCAVDREEASRGRDEIGQAGEHQHARHEAETRGRRHYSRQKRAILVQVKGRRNRRPRSGV